MCNIFESFPVKATFSFVDLVGEILGRMRDFPLRCLSSQLFPGSNFIKQANYQQIAQSTGRVCLVLRCADPIQ